MKIKHILIIIGLFLFLFALSGFFGVVGPNAQNSVFGETWWMNSEENWSHLSMGTIILLSALFFPKKTQKATAWLFAMGGIGLGVYSSITRHLLSVNVEDPIEEIIYFTLGNIILFFIVKEEREELKSELRLYNQKQTFEIKEKF